ncbi:Ammonia transport outward protein 2 [Wickerhamiella sorbophila]|uniref:Ammonia transport outward protein 2 n=1 Tax=Wickerhamiella sorbophila TaxID=45607 RepID=A0A2T0FMZ6_9ASCO|nr:Ammonia transport outward protein 2 [Wickerhamiella sorbophila]PRT56345.1 Ammonia transport outward protein 2 [Wickerhamiella sorbophila]
MSHNEVPEDQEKAMGLSPNEAHEYIKSATQYVKIGNKKVPLSEVLQAYGGFMNPGLAIKTKRKFGNPAPVGLCGFAATTFVLSCFNVKGLGITIPNVVVGMAWFYGGMIQFFAGMWELVCENTFGAAAFSVYGFFWMAFAALQTPSFGVAEAFDGDVTMLDNGIALFLLIMGIFTLILWTCTWKSTWAFSALFFFVFLTFLLLAIGNFIQKSSVVTGGGCMGLVAAILAWYNAYAGIAIPEISYVTVKPFYIPQFGKKD